MHPTTPKLTRAQELELLERKIAAARRCQYEDDLAMQARENACARRERTLKNWTNALIGATAILFLSFFVEL